MAKPHPMLQPLETERFILRPLGRFEAFRIGRSNWNHDPEIMRNLIHSAKPLDSLAVAEEDGLGERQVEVLPCHRSERMAANRSAYTA